MFYLVVGCDISDNIYIFLKGNLYDFLLCNTKEDILKNVDDQTVLVPIDRIK